MHAMASHGAAAGRGWRGVWCEIPGEVSALRAAAAGGAEVLSVFLRENFKISP